MSRQRDIRDALAASLRAYTWATMTDPVTVDAKNYAQYDIEDLGNPVIAVTSGAVESDRLARTAHQRDYSIEVLVARHAPTEALCDGMLDMLEELLDAIENHSWGAVSWPAGITSPQTVVVEKNPDEALVERNVWRAGIVVTYRYPRAH